MKNSLYIFLFILTSSNLFSQDWRDSLNVARSAYKEKNYGKASRYYQSAQRNVPKSFDFSNEMAQSAYKLGEYKRSENLYRKILSNKSSKLNKSKTHYNIGNTQMQQKKYKEAINSYKEALRSNPRDEQTRYNLSEAIRRLKDQQKKNDDKQDQEEKNNPKKNDQQNNPPKDKNQNQENKKSSTLPNKTVDKILDKLMKEESETKRKVTGKKGEKSETTSGKDW